MLKHLIPRMLRAAKLDPQLYEEVEHDPDATVQAAVVVLLASFLSGVGMLFTGGAKGLISGVLIALVGWVVWSAITFVVGTRVFGGKADLGEMLRVLGFAYTPHVLGIIPVLGGIVAFFWGVACMVVGVRQGLDVTTGKAVGTIIIGAIGYFVIAFVLTMVFGLGGALMSGGGLPAEAF